VATGTGVTFGVCEKVTGYVNVGVGLKVNGAVGEEVKIWVVVLVGIGKQGGFQIGLGVNIGVGNWKGGGNGSGVHLHIGVGDRRAEGRGQVISLSLGS
jgi:hypothetical protein